MSLINESFRTQLAIEKSKIQIGPENKIITIGSCFSDTIGQMLSEDKLTTLVNPFGTLFNPISIFEIIKSSILKKELDDRDFAQLNDGFVNFEYPNKFWSESKETLIEKLNNAQKSFEDYLKNADILIITLGSAWVHVLKDTQKIVANCHKQKSDVFIKKILDPNEILDSFSELKNLLPINLKIIFTLSPVRHTREGLPENQLSKSILRYSISKIQNLFPEIDYFPSYEIMIDDLRDYRFYSGDYIHPNFTANNYIKTIFEDIYFKKSTLEQSKAWSKLKKRIEHRPLNGLNESYKQFLENLKNDLITFNSTCNVEKEIAEVEEKIFLINKKTPY